jgi:hypothetical protein
MAMRWQDWMIPLIGLWLAVAPLIMIYEGGFGGVSAWNSYLVGIGLIAIPLLGLAKPVPGREWVVLALGVWLILSPFLLGFSAERIAFSNTALCGIVVTIAAAARLSAIGKGPRGA